MDEAAGGRSSREAVAGTGGGGRSEGGKRGKAESDDKTSSGEQNTPGIPSLGQRLPPPTPPYLLST